MITDFDWGILKCEYSGENLIYRGIHSNRKAATNDTGWFLWKFTYDEGKLIMIEGPAYDTWDNKAFIDWV